MNTESVILSHLLFTEQYSRKVLPYIKPEYFERKANKVIYELLNEFVIKYNAFPTKEALLIDLSNKTDINEQLFKEVKEAVIEVKPEAETNIDWLSNNTEAWCKKRAIHNAILESIKVIDQNGDEGSLPKIMQDALNVSFDTHVGHDFLEDAERRFDFYHTKEKKIPFSLGKFNEITNGGVSQKTLNLCMAVTGGGKSRFMCNEAAFQLRNGYNVLYITLEMAEERIAERIDANLLDITMEELHKVGKEIYDGKMAKLRSQAKGKLVIKEFPTAGAGVNHFRFLLNELRMKKNFIPDIVYIDYINICMSSRLKMGNNVASYGYIKAIAEELRGLAVEYKIPIFTATQINRSGFNNSDIEMEHTSESIGLPATVDLMFALIGSEELDQLNQIMVKQLKNRYGDPTFNKRFCVGVDKPKMRLYDLDNPTDGLMDEGSVMDKTEFGKRDKEFDMNKLKDFH